MHHRFTDHHQALILFKRRSQEWQAFTNAYPNWLADRQDADSALYCLPLAQIDEVLALFRLDENSETAERDFASLCNRHNAIGTANDRFCRLPLAAATAQASRR